MCVVPADLCDRVMRLRLDLTHRHAHRRIRRLGEHVELLKRDRVLADEIVKQVDLVLRRLVVVRARIADDTAHRKFAGRHAYEDHSDFGCKRQN